MSIVGENNNNGLLFAPTCTTCFNEDKFLLMLEKKCSLQWTNECLNSTGKCIIFSSEMYHRGYYNQKPDKIFTQVQLFCAPVIRHGLMLSLSILKWCNLLNSQLQVYVGDKQTPLDLLNLLPEGTDSDPGVWLTHHKSIPAFSCRNADRRSFGSKKILLEEFIDTYQIQRIRNSYALTSNVHLVRWSWYSDEDPFTGTYWIE